MFRSLYFASLLLQLKRCLRSGGLLVGELLVSVGECLGKVKWLHLAGVVNLFFGEERETEQKRMTMKIL